MNVAANPKAAPSLRREVHSPLVPGTVGLASQPCAYFVLTTGSRPTHNRGAGILNGRSKGPCECSSPSCPPGKTAWSVLPLSEHLARPGPLLVSIVPYCFVWFLALDDHYDDEAQLYFVLWEKAVLFLLLPLRLVCVISCSSYLPEPPSISQGQLHLSQPPLIHRHDLFTSKNGNLLQRASSKLLESPYLVKYSERASSDDLYSTDQPVRHRSQRSAIPCLCASNTTRDNCALLQNLFFCRLIADTHSSKAIRVCNKLVIDLSLTVDLIRYVTSPQPKSKPRYTVRIESIERMSVDASSSLAPSPSLPIKFIGHLCVEVYHSHCLVPMPSLGMFELWKLHSLPQLLRNFI